LAELIHATDLKLIHAGEQARSIINEITQWTTENKITTRCEKLERNLGFRLILNDFEGFSLLEKWSLDIGDCINNLRTSLDYLAFALARLKCDPPIKPGIISFPIYLLGDEFIRKEQECRKQMPDMAAKLIEQLQPFQRDGSPEKGIPESDPLLLLRDLNNTDKHRVPTAIHVSPAEISHSWSVEFESEDDAALNSPPDVTVWGGPLQPNCVLLEYRTKNPIKSIKGRFEHKGVISIINCGKTNNGKSYEVNPTLAGLIYYVDLVIAQFRGFFMNSK
jgi:hypothetical protein